MSKTPKTQHDAKTLPPLSVNYPAAVVVKDGKRGDWYLPVAKTAWWFLSLDFHEARSHLIGCFEGAWVLATAHVENDGEDIIQQVRPINEVEAVACFLNLGGALPKELRSFRPGPPQVLPSVDSPYLNAKEAAAYLRLETAKALHQLVDRGKLKPLPGHGEYRFTEDMLDKYLHGEGLPAGKRGAGKPASGRGAAKSTNKRRPRTRGLSN